jgi:hypothetical protein
VGVGVGVRVASQGQPDFVSMPKTSGSAATHSALQALLPVANTEGDRAEVAAWLEGEPGVGVPVPAQGKTSSSSEGPLQLPPFPLLTPTQFRSLSPGRKASQKPPLPRMQSHTSPNLPSLPPLSAFLAPSGSHLKPGSEGDRLSPHKAPSTPTPKITTTATKPLPGPVEWYLPSSDDGDCTSGSESISDFAATQRGAARAMHNTLAGRSSRSWQNASRGGFEKFVKSLGTKQPWCSHMEWAGMDAVPVVTTSRRAQGQGGPLERERREGVGEVDGGNNNGQQARQHGRCHGVEADSVMAYYDS